MEEKKLAQTDSEELLELMRKIESENAAQARYAKKQCRIAWIRAAASILVLVVVVACAAVLMPRVLQIMGQADTLLAELETITEELSQSLPEVLENLNTLVEDSQNGITEAMDKVSALDIGSLNKAIQDLHSVVEPLAKLFGR